MSWCILDWDPRPTWNGSHIHSKHIQGCLRTFVCCGWADGSTIMPLPPYLFNWQIFGESVLGQFLGNICGLGYKWCKVHWLRPQIHMEWFLLYFYHMPGVCEHSYAVDGQMDPQSCHFHHTCWPWLLDQVDQTPEYHLGYKTSDVREHWIRAQELMECFPQCSRTFICWGWTDGSTIMPLPPYLLTLTFGTSWIPTGSICAVNVSNDGKGALVEASDSHGIVPTCTPNICKAFKNCWPRISAMTSDGRTPG